MSVFVKDMDMPKNGEITIAFASDENGENTLALILDTNGKPIEHKGVVEIHTPHGRLIDADRLMEVIEKNSYLLKGYYNSLENGMFLTGIKQAIDEAPTIIDVEVSE